MRDISFIFIHCTDTPNGSSLYGPRDIDRWHAERISKGELEGRGEEAVKAYNSCFPYVGYHSLITPDGVIHPGRGDNERGSHAAGYNKSSLAVTLFGRDKYTQAQWDALKWCVEDWQSRYGEIAVRGHNEVSGKSCPGFTVADWLGNGKQALVSHLL